MDENNEKIIFAQTDGSPDGGRLRGIVDKDPRLRALIGRLSPDEARRLGGVLSDPEKLKSVLSSPQAQRLLKKHCGPDKK